MCCCTLEYCKRTQTIMNKGTKTLRKECFTNICPNTSFFYWLIMLWIFLIVVSIGIYGVLLVKVVTWHDTETSHMIMNLVIQIVNVLFTLAAVLNLPVRCRRLYKLWKKRAVVRRTLRVSLSLFRSIDPLFVTQSTDAWEEESKLIFDRLELSTQHIILQALLWNSLFQIINQVFRCIYYSYELAHSHPGIIFVNTFFPLAILASIVAAFIQALAENRFRDKHSLSKRRNNIWKTMVEFWHNLWKVQTEAQVAIAQQFDKRSFSLIENPFLNLKQREVDLNNIIGELEQYDDDTNKTESDMNNDICIKYPEKKIGIDEMTLNEIDISEVLGNKTGSLSKNHLRDSRQLTSVPLEDGNGGIELGNVRNDSGINEKVCIIRIVYEK